MLTGTITAVRDSGFGFIRRDGSNERKETFFHRSGLDPSLEFGEHLIELPVVYEVENSDRGPRAVNVRAAT